MVLAGNQINTKAPVQKFDQPGPRIIIRQVPKAFGLSAATHYALLLQSNVKQSARREMKNMSSLSFYWLFRTSVTPSDYAASSRTSSFNQSMKSCTAFRLAVSGNASA